MKLAPEGATQMMASTALFGSGAFAAVCWFWPAVIPIALIWAWSIAFFRDPRRVANVGPGELCSPADGTVLDITQLEHHDAIEGPAVRIGIFLSLFDVHINRSPCVGTVRSVQYRKGRFLAAMNPEAGRVNESNTLVIDPAPPIPGPIVVRQVAGIAARRIICHAKAGTSLAAGERFGLIKYGSRTELIVPTADATEVLVQVGDKVRAGLTLMVRQRPAVAEGMNDARDHENAVGFAATPS